MVKTKTCGSLVVILLALASPAAAWDGPGLWHSPADAANPGGGGIFGTGGARDYGITCESCHVDRPTTGSIDALVTFTPQLGPGGLYTPDQSYQVRVDLVGEFLGLSGCGAYTSNANNFAADFEGAAGAIVGILTSDSGQTQTSCPFDYPMPMTGTTGLYRDCEVIFGREEADLTAWTFTWRAPAAGAGAITMHYGVVDGDCGMMSMGDAVKVGTVALAEGTASRRARTRPGSGLALALLLLPAGLWAMRRRVGAVAAVALLAASCGGSAKEDGTLGGKCLPGGACAAGLICEDDVCVEETGGGDAAVGDAAAADGGAIDATIADATGSPPTAQINHPGDGEMRPAAMDIPFIGVAGDPEDGPLSGASMVWTSDLAGEIGTGESFNAPLSAGMHVITLTATDSDGNTGTDQITLDIQ
jgi:hypothetical protein